MTSGGSPLVCAAVDVGSNSAHVLVARVTAAGLEPLLDESALLGLGAIVDATGVVGTAPLAGLVEALREYAARARALGASRIAFVGTEPLRRAADARRAVSSVEAAVGVPLHVLDHHEEGLLTLLGATAGRMETGPFLVADIGGGSSELVFAGGGARPRTIGLRLGGSRLARAIGIGDPPTSGDLRALFRAARVALDAGIDGAPEPPPATPPGRLIAVGGTASNLAKLVPGHLVDGVLDLGGLDVALERLSSLPADQLGPPYIIRPQRIRQLPAGAAILRAILDRYGLDRAVVTDRGIREGLVSVLATAGSAWRDRLEALAAAA